MTFDKITAGWCPVCEQDTAFRSKNPWLRDHYRCARCQSMPRQRHLMYILNQIRPNWRSLTIHESSPGGATFVKMREECPNYSFSHYLPDTQLGGIDPQSGTRSEDLRQMTFMDQSFDIFVTQDVLEHIYSPAKVFSEIHRVLKNDGIHIFTVPIYKALPQSRKRAELNQNGEILHLHDAVYHGNPISSLGSLVTYDWNLDIVHAIYKETGMITTVYLTRDEHLGLEAEFLEVLVSEKME